MNYIFYDFETSGRNSDWDQILQLGAILTNDKFEEIDRFETKCYLKPGHIPSAQALMVNKITVKDLMSTNLSHYELINQIEKKFRFWGPAIFIGYNSLNFDEEFLRKSFFKFLYDPYLTSNNGNKRADLLGLIRAVKTYNPEIIKFPYDEKGNTIFKLDKLAPINGVIDFKAHDAMGDTFATMKLAELINDQDKKLWESSLETTNREDTNLTIEKHRTFCITESFFGKTLPYVVCFVCYHPVYKWAQGFDLKNDPAKYQNLSIELLEHAMSTSPKIIRSIKNNKHPIILNKEYISILKEYSHLSTKELLSRAEKIEKDEEFRQKVRIILDKQASIKEDNLSQLDVSHEETIYFGFASNAEKDIMKEFHLTDWENKLKIANKFKEERHFYFAERLIYEENPQYLPGDLYKKINRNIANQILSNNDEKWNTIPKVYKEIDDLRDKYEEENNEENLKILDDLNNFIEDIEKKFQEA